MSQELFCFGMMNNISAGWSNVAEDEMILEFMSKNSNFLCKYVEIMPLSVSGSQFWPSNLQKGNCSCSLVLINVDRCCIQP